MSDRHDLRRQTREIHDALNRFDREQLVDILTHIFRTYVMEGATLASPQAPALGDELAGLSFAQLLERLQLRLDLPELQLFEVQGGRVSVRIDGRLTPLEVPAARSEPPAPAPARAPVANGPAVVVATPVAPPAASTPGTAVESRAGAPPPGVAPAGHASSARPEAGARPTGARAAGHASSAQRQAAGPGPGPGSSPGAAQPPAAAPAPAAPAKQEKPAEDNSQGGRFGLLEID